MEKLLLSLARQLDALDEASLMDLWDTYANRVANFEPTKRWEEAALVFSFIQAKNWKNQLFNYSWSQQMRPDMPIIQVPAFQLEQPIKNKKAKEKVKANQLVFSPKEKL